MEESEKRRERLRAMRMEAAHAEVCANVETSAVPGSLSNPLLENSTTQPWEGSYGTPRFDYYTDPMSAFSSNKKRGQPYSQIAKGPRNPVMSPSPAYQLQNSSSFERRIYQAPRGVASPAPPPYRQGTPEAWNESGGTSGYYSSGAHGHRSPRGMTSPFPRIHQGPPEAWNTSVGTASYNSPSNASAGGQFFSPGFGPLRSPNFNYGQGRPNWYCSSPSAGSGCGGSPGLNSGRGRGHWRGSSTSPGLGRSGGRGRAFHFRGSGTEGRQAPEHFYHKSMDEDPWQQLQPLIWRNRSLESPGCSNSWLPKSISMKKARVTEAKSSSEPSLAEYLAASFKEAVNDSPSS